MNMRTFSIAIIAVIAVSLYTGPARAATTSLLVERGSTATVQVGNSLPTADPDCSVNVSVEIDASTSLQRPDGSTSAGAVVTIFRSDDCAGISEFGAAFVSLPTSQVQIGGGGRSATLNATIPVEMFVFSPAGETTIMRTVTVAVQLQATSDSAASTSHARFGGGGIMIVRNGHGVFAFASVAGQVSLDGQALITPTGATSGSIQTSNDTQVIITK
jgi:hypothetical protein